MNWSDFFQAIKTGNVPNLILFSGPEEYLKREAIAALRAALLPPGLEALNEMILEGASAREIMDAADTLPMMCSRRIVIVRDWAPMLPGKSKDEEDESALIGKWIQNPPSGCVTVFTFRNDPDNRKKATGLLRKAATVVEFDSLNDAHLKQWANRRLKPYGKKIAPDALSALAFMAGRDLTRLSGELDKLAAYVGDADTVALVDVHAIVSPSLEYNVFELMNRLLDGKLGDAEKMLSNLLQNGQNPVGLLAMLSRQLRQLTHMRLALDAGQPVLKVQEALKLHPYAAKQIARQAKLRSANAFRALFEDAVEYDFAIKSGKIRDIEALGALMIKISDSKLAKRGN